MWAAFYHLRRYSCWALFGTLILLAWPVIFELRIEGSRLFWDRVLLFTFSIGGMLLVIPRALVGVSTGWKPTVADRAMAVWIGRFFRGWLVGLGIALFLLLFFPGISSGRHIPPGSRPLPIGIWDWFIPVSMFVGGVSGILTGWLLRRRARRLLPLAWLVVFAALLTGWLTANDYLLHQSRSIIRGLGLPL